MPGGTIKLRTVVNALQRSRGVSPFAQWLILAASLLIVGGAIAVNLYSTRSATHSRELARLAAQVQIVDENLARELRATSRALELLRSDLPLLKSQRDGAALVDRHLRTLGEAMPGVRTLLVLDADGTAISSNRGELLGRSFRERAYFQTARASRDPATLHLSAPFTTALGIFGMNLVKVIHDERGEFAGVISATLDPDFFSTLLKSVCYAPDMWTALAHADGKLFLMMPARPGIEGKDLANTGSFFTRHLESRQIANAWTGIAYATGEESIIALRTIEPAGLAMDKSLVIAAARVLPAIFADWRREAAIQGGLFGLLVVTAALGLAFQQRRQITYDRLLESGAALRKTLEAGLRRSASVFTSSQEGILITDAGNRVTDVNPAFTRITGYGREEIIGRNPRILSSGRHGREFYAGMYASIAQAGSWQGEIWNRRKSGEIYPERLTIDTLRDEDGTVAQYIAVFSDITGIKAHEVELDRLAYFDVLTGAPNRRLFTDRLDQAIVRAKRSGKLIAVCYLDLDGFKPVNDRFGHAAGDKLLVEVTDRLRAILRGEDTLARLGGDEFALIFTELGEPGEIDPMLERMLVSISAPIVIEGTAVGVSASIGVALYPADAADADTLLRCADQAMYRAKDAGKNCYYRSGQKGWKWPNPPAGGG